MKNGIGWAAAGVGALLCLACCLPPLAALGVEVAALVLGYVAAQVAGALPALGLIAVVTIALTAMRRRRRAPHPVWPEPAVKESQV